MPGQRLARESTTDNSLKDNMRHIRIAALLAAFGMTFGAIFAFLVIIAVLIVKPSGLLGSKEVVRV